MANTLTFESQIIADDHIFGGVNYLADLNVSDEFTIGNTASASVSFVTDIRLPLYTKDSTNGRFSRTQGNGENIADNDDNQLVTDDNQLFAIETARGRFFITEITKGDGLYTVKAYDAMILLETNISALSLSFPLSVSAAASAIATYIGGSVSGTIHNGTLSVSELDEDMTIRELLGYVAEASGCSVKIDEDGRLCFMYYEDSGITLTASDYKKLEVADYTCAAIDNVTILNSVGAAVATAGSGSNTLYIEGNPFLEEATNTEAALILSLVEDFEYAPLTCEMFDENELQVGTIATFGTTPTLVMHLESSEEGAIASSVGSDSRAEYNKSFETMLAAATKEALEAADEASTKATKYITRIDNSGIKVHAENYIDYNYAKINGDGMEVYKGAVSVAKYGDTARIGALATPHINLDSGGMEILADTSTSIAHLGYGTVNDTSGTTTDPYFVLGSLDSSLAGIGRMSLAVGTSVRASGAFSCARGQTASASGWASFASGYTANASGLAAHAFGYNVSAEAQGQVVVGQYNASDSDSLFIVGNGYSASTRNNALSVKRNGMVLMHNGNANVPPVFSTPPASETYGCIIRLRGDGWPGSAGTMDTYWLGVGSSGKLYTGIQLNGAAAVTWREK